MGRSVAEYELVPKPAAVVMENKENKDLRELGVWHFLRNQLQKSKIIGRDYDLCLVLQGLS